jgi:hypothetical protein
LTHNDTFPILPVTVREHLSFRIKGAIFGTKTTGGIMMHVYTKIYEFAATVGAFEGYVYGKETIDPDDVTRWVNNIVTAYKHLPSDVIDTFRSSLDGTLGRAARSLTSALGENNKLVQKLRSIIKDDFTKSADDFNFKKWFQE